MECCEEQAAFRAGRSPVDHIFTISELFKIPEGSSKGDLLRFPGYQKSLRLFGQKYHLEKVDRCWPTWEDVEGAKNVVESSVLVGHRRTEWFPVEAGVRQGCILSPILFEGIKCFSLPMTWPS